MAIARGYQQITSLAAAQALTPPASAPGWGAVYKALIQAEAQDCRWRDDGVDPTAAVGMILPAKTTLEYEGSLHKFKIIETAASAKVNVSYYAP